MPSALRTAAPLLILLAPVATTSCKNLKLPDLSNVQPKATFDRVDFGKADWQGVDTEFVINIANPNPVGVGVQRWSWNLALAEQPFLSGDGDKGFAVAANGSSPLVIPTRLDFSDMLDTAKALKGQDDVPYTVGGDLSVNTPVGPVTLPWRHSGSFPVLKKPTFKLKGLRLQSLDVLKGRADLALDLGITHGGGAKLALDGLDWNVGLGGKPAADGALGKALSLSDGNTETVSLPIGVNLLQIGASIAKAIKDKGPIDVSLDASTGVGTPLGSIPLKVNEATTLRVSQ